MENVWGGGVSPLLDGGLDGDRRQLAQLAQVAQSAFVYAASPFKAARLPQSTYRRQICQICDKPLRNLSVKLRTSCCEGSVSAP
ncbi:MAG: hypothetical protein DCF17_15100 [Shackletoniella antarctica]|uniref:Uncharacterized protein n=1 Tax=Shackletoniella antarctica TaxID=268115 RepID=A0A2W4Y442_9CYAN|nr:MAG: hypothetical protein DCF17_15100 [Shackletoniella antarctica]